MDNLLAIGVVLAFLTIISLVTGALAARKGYKFIIWFFGGGIIGLIALCFLPFANSPELPEWEKRARVEKGNHLGYKIIVVNILLMVIRLMAN
jgi:MFS family permease